MAIVSTFNTRGVGSPEGKVSAPVGTIYTDSAATNGAVRWIKASGTGSTGWVVEYGDTGWRDVASLLINGWETLVITVRRHNQTVSLRFTGLTGASATSPRMIELPPGFFSGRTRVPITGNGEVVTAQITSTGALDLVTSFSVPASNYWSDTTWSTDTPWPTTLPGTPL